MGMGFQPKKKTNKALENDQKQLETRLRNALMMVQMQLNQMSQKVSMLERQAELIDYRSLATMKLAQDKFVFTEAEHDAAAETLRIATFTEQSERDNETRNLKPTDEGLVNDVVYVFRIDAFEGATVRGVDGNEIPNPNAGVKIESLSLLRMKVAYGAGEFPKEIEDQLAGAKAGETRSFEIVAPKTLGSWEGRPVRFNVDVLQTFKAEPKEVPVTGTGETVTAETAAAPLAVVSSDEQPN